MIPRSAIVAWSQTVAHWPTENQVEQDLLLSRLIIEIAKHDYLGKELVFRGGTCFHKLCLQRPLRYSEDLDYVRTSATGINELTRALSQIGEHLGMTVKTKIGQQPKVYLRSSFESDATRMQVKIEVNTFERSPAQDLRTIRYSVHSNWFSGNADVQTFATAELLATKIRALFQRRKGRDLFDLWLGLTEMAVDPAEIIASFSPYRPNGYTSARGIETLKDHLSHEQFRNDLFLLVREIPIDYDPRQAAELIIRELLSGL